MAVQGNEPVDPGYFAEVEDLFFDALELPPNQRETWLQEKCQDRQEIYTEVQTLLEAHVSSEEFLSESPDLTGIAACPDLSGRRLGSYQVDTEIAKGGMGRVYSADRVDGEYEQRVAVKVVELGNIEAELFRRERQTLANLEHPNIVTLLDGGTLEEGFPYLVMELVDGQAIDLYNISHSLSRQELITLFCTLCEVVNRAHQQGVIHCDLKPANILVTERGILKLLDFGISQTLIKTQDSQSDSIQSQALTPEYASPQRQAHKPPHVTDDIYSLGIILGQLLIGESLPRVATELLVKKKYKKIDIDQMLQLVPSHELRMVIKKATDDEQDNRYQSAGLLAADLQNFLQNKPVEAISGGKNWQFYTFYKNLTRNRNFWAVVIVATALLIAAYFWNKQNLYDANTRAASLAKKVTTDLAEVLSRTQPSIDVQAELTGLTIQNIEKVVEEAPGNIPAIHALSEGLVRLGQLEGHPLYLNRANREEAKTYLAQAEFRLEGLKQLIDDGEADFSIVVDDEVNEEVVMYDLLRVKRLLAEIGLYSGDRVKSIGEMLLLEKQFNERRFTLESRKQVLSHMHDLLAWANFNLLIDKYELTTDYLERAESFSNRVTTLQSEIIPKAPERNVDESKLTNKQRQQLRQQRKESERVEREKFEFFKDARYLKALSEEHKGHIAFMKEDYQAASRYYLSVVDTSSVDVHLTPLLGRINSIQACIALKTNQPKLASELLEKIKQRYEALIFAHPGSRRHEVRLERLSDSSLSIEEQLGCDDPRSSMFPLRQLPPQSAEQDDLAE